jgi:hypothetical protein
MAVKHARHIALTLCATLAITGAATAYGATAGHTPKTLAIASLDRDSQAQLRDAGIVGSTMALGGPAIAGMSLYRAAYEPGGACMVAVRGKRITGSDCDRQMFTGAMPGYATGLSLIPMTPKGTPDDSRARLAWVYGMATARVTTALLLGVNSTTTLDVTHGPNGLVVFSSAAPPADGKTVQLLDRFGRVLQTIRVA